MILFSKRGLTYAKSITFSRGLLLVKFITSFKIKKARGRVSFFMGKPNITNFFQVASPTDHTFKELRRTKQPNTAIPKRRRLKAQFLLKRKQEGA
jgi:hypothetical protein